MGEIEGGMKMAAAAAAPTELLAIWRKVWGVSMRIDIVKSPPMLHGQTAAAALVKSQHVTTTVLFR